MLALALRVRTPCCQGPPEQSLACLASLPSSCRCYRASPWLLLLLQLLS